MLSTGLWIIMIISVGAVIVASFTHFNPGLAFSYPAGAFTLSGHFFVGLGAGLLIGIYDYLGYNTTAYMGSEIKNPGPRHALVNYPVYSRYDGVVSVHEYWRHGCGTLANGRQFHFGRLARAGTTWGHGVAIAVTVLILITAFASVFAGLLGGSRVPYNAARDGLFFRAFRKDAPALPLPLYCAAGDGVITAIGSL